MGRWCRQLPGRLLAVRNVVGGMEGHDARCKEALRIPLHSSDDNQGSRGTWCRYSSEKKMKYR